MRISWLKEKIFFLFLEWTQLSLIHAEKILWFTGMVNYVTCFYNTQTTGWASKSYFVSFKANICLNRNTLTILKITTLEFLFHTMGKLFINISPPLKQNILHLHDRSGVVFWLEYWIGHKCVYVWVYSNLEYTYLKLCPSTLFVSRVRSRVLNSEAHVVNMSINLNIEFTKTWEVLFKSSYTKLNSFGIIKDLRHCKLCQDPTIRPWNERKDSIRASSIVMDRSYLFQRVPPSVQVLRFWMLQNNYILNHLLWLN